MLRHLSVENYALIDKFDMELAPGLNIITGETGAGKSILLGALGLLAGAKADAGVWKNPASNCVVEGVFDVTDAGLEPFFEENDLEWSATTILRRVVSPSGKSRAYVNDLPVQLATLRDLGERLFDIHSQHQNLLLRDDAFRLRVVDGMADHADLLARYKTLYRELRQTRREWDEAMEACERSRRDEAWLRFQVEEFEAAALRVGEQAELEAEQTELTHADDIRETLATVGTGLAEEESGILVRLKSDVTALRRVESLYPAAGSYAARIESAYLELKDLESEFSREVDRIESDPARLEFVSDRLNTLWTLQQKHHVASEEELLALQRDYTARLELIEHGEERLEALRIRAEKLEAEARSLAGQLSLDRKRVAVRLQREVEELLARLGMPGARFEANIVETPELAPTGCDEVEFLFTANAGMPLRPVEKIASGGEISRVMLALKSLAVRHAGQPTIVFDEIDTGVSGRVADAMGEIILSLASGMQVINITHLPQIAAKGSTHFFVYKEDGASRIDRLTPERRVEEIAKMLSGTAVTDAALRQAALLIGEGGKS